MCKKKVPPGQKVENMNFFFSVTMSFQGKCGIGPKLENKQAIGLGMIRIRKSTGDIVNKELFS